MQKSSTHTFAGQLEEQYASYRSDAFASRRFSPEQFHHVLDEIAGKSSGLLSIKKAGESFEGRPIRLVTAGTGPLSVLLWSQMHGDESTATMAITDILMYLSKTNKEDYTKKILSALTLHFLPMLNPDAAARFQRRTAQGIDMNRDALSLRTPEARILKQLQQELKPHFGFNLHDQELSTVSTTKELTAIAVLAPAFNPEKKDNEIRTRAKHLAAFFAGVANRFAPKKVARYDDSFEPRAFGDNMQKWGTSTVLVESGHAMDDREKNSIRKLNVIGILASLYAIANGEYEQSDTNIYESLPFNGKRAYDLIIRDIAIDHGNGTSTMADIGVSYQVDTHTESTPVLVDLGDLHTFIGLKEIDGKGKPIPHAKLVFGKAFAWESFFTH
jgi:predicted deacylase